MFKFLLASFLSAMLALNAWAIGGIGGGTLNSYSWTADGSVIYPPNADGSFNINPDGGLPNVWIGTNRLVDLPVGHASSADNATWACKLGTVNAWTYTDSNGTWQAAATYPSATNNLIVVATADGIDPYDGPSIGAVFSNPVVWGDDSTHWTSATYPNVDFVWDDPASINTWSMQTTDGKSWFLSPTTGYAMPRSFDSTLTTGGLVIDWQTATTNRARIATTNDLTGLATTGQLSAYVPTNDTRYLAALTNGAAFDQFGAAAAVSNVVAGTWSNAVVTGNTLTLDWSAGRFRSFAPTNASYTVAVTNTPAPPPAVMELLLTTPATTLPTISWPAGLSWSAQLDMTSNRTYMVCLIWDGGAYVAVPLYSR